MSSTNKTSNYQLSQFVGTDIPSILNDYNGDMRKIDTAIKDIANAEGSSASDIAELQSTVGQHTTEISGINSTVNSLTGRVIGIEGKIPTNASESNKLITAEDIPEIPSIEELEADVNGIKTVIPTNASAQNKLITAEDIPEIPSIEELEESVNDLGETVKSVDLEVQSINTKIPSNASSSNKLATIADIGGGYVGTVTATDNEDFASFFSRVAQYIVENFNSNSYHKVKLQISTRITRNNPIWLNLTSANVSGSNVTFTFSSSKANGDFYLVNLSTNESDNYITRYSLTFDNNYNISESNYTDGAVSGYTVTVSNGNTVDSATHANIWS